VGVGVGAGVLVMVGAPVGSAVGTIISLELEEPLHAAAAVAKAMSTISFASGWSDLRECIGVPFSLS